MREIVASDAMAIVVERYRARGDRVPTRVRVGELGLEGDAAVLLALAPTMPALASAYGVGEVFEVDDDLVGFARVGGNIVAQSKSGRCFVGGRETTVAQLVGVELGAIAAPAVRVIVDDVEAMDGEIDAVGVAVQWDDRGVASGGIADAEWWSSPAAAVVARALGAMVGQGHPAGTLSAWTIGRDRALGFARANARAVEAIARLSSGWPIGALEPRADHAAIRVIGDELEITATGGCDVYRVGRGLEVLRDSQRDAPDDFAAEIMRSIAGDRVSDLFARLGSQGQQLAAGMRPPLIVTVPKIAGETFVLTTWPPIAFAAFAEACTRMDLPPRERIVRLRELAMRGDAHGEVAVVFATVGDATSGPIVATSPEPPISWVYHPGGDLAAMPADLPTGPSQDWFDLMAALGLR